MPMPPKICLVTPEYPPLRWGGLARTAWRVSEHLAALGLAVHVVHYRPVDGTPPLLDENRQTRCLDGITVHDVALGRETFDAGRTLWDCPHTLTLLMLFESLEMLHREERFDAFLSFFLYPTGYVAGLLSRRERRPHVTCVVGNDVKKYFFSPEKAGLCRSGLENADRVVFLAEDLLALADSLTPVRDKSRVIFNSVVAGAAPWPGPRTHGPFAMRAAGIFKHAKGLPYLFKAMAQLGQTGDVVLDIAGETRPEEIPLRESLLDRFDLRASVRLHGVVPHEALPAWLVQGDVFVLPSVSEGCPNVLMEAMAVGMPCVATRVGAAEELVEDGVSGLLVDWGDAGQLAGALDRLRSDPGLAAALGHEAAKRMAAHTPERERREWEAVFREIVSW
jgi:glycosyltransferase involved in cell wall biosynthesis